MNDPSPKARAILDVVEMIPAGSVMAYGDVAACAGVGSARYVGHVLARYGHEVPWHRVVMADGSFARHLADEQSLTAPSRKSPRVRWTGRYEDGSLRVTSPWTHTSLRGRGEPMPELTIIDESVHTVTGTTEGDRLLVDAAAFHDAAGWELSRRVSVAATSASRWPTLDR